MSKSKILVIGNCFSMALSRAVKALCPESDVVCAHFQVDDIVELVSTEGASADLIYAQLGLEENIYPANLQQVVDTFSGRTINYPRIVFPAFHPDCVYSWNRQTGGGVHHPLSYHSAITVEAFRRGLSVDATIGLFNGDTFDALGYFDYMEPSIEALVGECRKAGLPTDAFPGMWLGRAFMYSVNHPRMFVAWDTAEYLLRNAGMRPQRLDRERGQIDPFFLGPQWPVYPEIAERLGVPGGYQFLESTDFSPGAEHKMHDLRGFVELSFATYRELDFATVALSRPTTEQYEQVGSDLFDAAFAIGRAGPPSIPRKMHPYATLPSRQFWRHAIAKTPSMAVDPMNSAPFIIERETRIATAGSCFAQHIARNLTKSGHQYLVVEQAPSELDPEVAWQRGFGVFSARYGNIYTARQLVQLIRRAFGTFTPLDSVWERSDGRFVDPFRPQIEPSGFASVEEVAAARTEHLAAVRRLIVEAEVFVFTLGLTEGWRRRSDGAVFPVCPGVSGGIFDPSRYEFVNFNVSEVTADLTEFIDLVRIENPKMRFVLTVSPVPLIATYEPHHVLNSTSYSKSVLRVAAEEISRQIGEVAYFPSFEIITGIFNRGTYFGPDLREVEPAGVDHAMRLFFKHFTIENRASNAEQIQSTDSRAQDRSRRAASQIQGLFKVLCDEEALDRPSN